MDDHVCPVIIYVFSFLTQINDDLCAAYLNIATNRISVKHVCIFIIRALLYNKHELTL